MLERLSRTKRNVALGGIGLLLLWFAWTVRSVLNPLILGYLLAYIVHPLVVSLERHGWRRSRAVNLIFVTGFLALSLLALAVMQQSHSLVRTLSARGEATTDGDGQPPKGLITNAIDRIEDFLGNHESWFAWILPDEEETPPEEGAPVAPEEVQVPATPEEESAALGADPTESGGAEEPDGAAAEEEFDLNVLLLALWDRLMAEGDGEARTAAMRGASGAWRVAQRFFGSLMALVGLIVLLPIYTYFLLFELDRIHGFVLRYLPKRERERFSRIGRQIGEVLANFFRGRLLVCFLKGAFLSLALAMTGVDYALLLGMGSGILSLVPFVGPLVGFLFATLVALLDPDFGVVGALVRTGSVFAAAELIEGYILVPKILGNSLGLHPIVVLLSIFVGGAALGMFGLLIAVPLTASLIILVRELVLPALTDFAEEDEEVSP